MMSDDVVVVGQRLNTYEGEYLSIPAIAIPVNNLQSDGQTLREKLQERGNRKDPVSISATSTSPATTIIGVSTSEAAAVAAALTNAKNSSDLNRSFSEMVARNVSLRVEVVQTAPSGFDPAQTGQVNIPALEPVAGGAQSFKENTEVTIIVVGSRLNRPEFGNESFRSVFAHELAHLIRDANNRFLTDTSGGAYAADGPLQRELFNGFKEKNFLDTPDIVSNVAQDDTLVFGPQYELSGTNNNNYILGPNFMAQGTIYTGDGDDIFLSYGTANVYVTHQGAKLLYTTNIGSLIYPAGTDVRSARLERIGNDLYITYNFNDSSLLADNVVILFDHFVSGAFYGMTAEGDRVEDYYYFNGR